MCLSLTSGLLLQLQQSLDGGGGGLGLPDRHVLVDDGGGGTGLHHLLLHPILLPSGHQVNYRLRVWKGNQKVDIQT